MRNEEPYIVMKMAQSRDAEVRLASLTVLDLGCDICLHPCALGHRLIGSALGGVQGTISRCYGTLSFS